jgi:hypothetical protein
VRIEVKQQTSPISEQSWRHQPIKSRHAGGTLAEFNIDLPYERGLRLAIDAQTHSTLVYSEGDIHVTNKDARGQLASFISSTFNFFTRRVPALFITKAG